MTGSAKCSMVKLLATPPCAPFAAGSTLMVRFPRWSDTARRWRCPATGTRSEDAEAGVPATQPRRRLIAGHWG